MDIKELSGESLVRFIKYKIKEFKRSGALKEIKDGEAYYTGQQKIDGKKRLGADDKGKLVTLPGLPNTICKDNQYAKLVDQKINYLLSQTPVVSCDDDEDYATQLAEFIDRRFMRTWQKIGKDALNCRIGWMYLYTDGKELQYQKVSAREVIPIWSDVERESLDALIRMRTELAWDDEQAKVVQKNFVEFYTDDSVQVFEVTGKDRYTLVQDSGYLTDAKGKQWSWGKIPFIYWRYTSEEITLLSRVKTLQDTLNIILSTFGDNMLEDNRNTILVLRGYDGENPFEVRGEMNASGVLQVQEDGGVDTLRIEVNAENYKTYLEIIKDKLIENGRGIDAKQERAGNAPNELNIKSMYSDIELDANGMELEYQASFEHLQWFFRKVYGLGEDGPVASIEFKRSIMVNEESLVGMIRASAGIVSERTLREHHPLVDDIYEEEQRLKDERAETEQQLDPEALKAALGDDHGQADG